MATTSSSGRCSKIPIIMTITAATTFTLHNPGPLPLRAFTEGWSTIPPTDYVLGMGGGHREALLAYLQNPEDERWQRMIPPDQHYISPILSGAMGDVSVTIRVHDSEPLLVEEEQWDRIEQAGAEFGYLPPLFIPAEHYEYLNQVTAEVRAAIGDGWHMVRMSCSSLQFDIREQLVDQSRAQIDIWPSSGPAGHTTIKRVPATPRPADITTAPATSLDDAWNTLVAALHAHGVTDHPVYHLQLATGDYGPVSDDPHLAGINVIGDTGRWFASLQSLPEPRVAGMVPGLDLLRSDAAGAVRSMLIDAWAPAQTYPEGYPLRAGDPTYTFIPDYVPIFERDGTALVIDTRVGPARGAIRLFSKVDADDTTTGWASLADLLTALTEALTTATPFLGWRSTITAGGQLHWHPA